MSQDIKASSPFIDLKTASLSLSDRGKKWMTGWQCSIISCCEFSVKRKAKSPYLGLLVGPQCLLSFLPSLDFKPTDRWMDKEAVAYLHRWVLVTHKEEQHYVIFGETDEDGDRNVTLYYFYVTGAKNMTETRDRRFILDSGFQRTAIYHDTAEWLGLWRWEYTGVTVHKVADRKQKARPNQGLM